MISSTTISASNRLSVSPSTDNDIENILHQCLEKIDATLSQPIQPTPLKQIALDQISKEKLTGMTLFVQDESTNPTGTHKAYLGHATLRIYKNIISDRFKNKNFEKQLPNFSIYSS